MQPTTKDPETGKSVDAYPDRMATRLKIAIRKALRFDVLSKLECVGTCGRVLMNNKLYVITWLGILAAVTFATYVYVTTISCPPNALCLTSGPHHTEVPFSEYTEVTQTTIVYSVKGKLEDKQSPYQRVEVYDTYFFGKILVIDGALMITERDECNYHEMIIHTPLAYIPNAKRILVVGGGDGGSVTQAVKHPNLEQIIWCELDELVVETSRKHFPHLAEAQKDKRVKLVLRNAANWVEEQQFAATASVDGKFDVIVLDTTDFNQAEPLFTNAFYQNCKQLLTPGGILVFNADSPQWGQIRMAKAAEQLTHVFKRTFVFQAYQPTYSSGHYSFVLCSDTVHPFETPVDWEAFLAKRISTRYYTPDLHYASFALPAQVQTVVHHVPKMLQIKHPFARY